MRDILFRGKCLDNDEWVYGDLLQFQDRTVIHSTANGCRVADAVDPTTVGQYTGLKDKNGNRIFEGDIVRYFEHQFDGKDEPVCGAVVYEEGGFAVRAYFLNNWLWDSIHGNIQLRDVEIIGNIHDTPELLKGGDEE